MVFDERAADRDPSFRRVFSNEIPPELKMQGRTLIVISHDDRFFHVADLLVTLDDGRLREVPSSAAPRASTAPCENTAVRALAVDVQGPA